MHMGFTGLLIARAVFATSIKVHGLQPGAPKSREHDFPKKKCPFFLNFIGPVTPPWVLYPSEIMHMVSTVMLLARAMIERSIKVLAWQPGAPKSREHDFPKKKNVLLLKIIGPVTPPWVLYPSEIMHLGSTEILMARAVFTRSIKVPGWQPGAPKPCEHRLKSRERFASLLSTNKFGVLESGLKIAGLHYQPLLECQGLFNSRLWSGIIVCRLD